LQGSEEQPGIVVTTLASKQMSSLRCDHEPMKC
jgi:hypothetical protein